MSMIDLFASSLGAFILIAIILFPYYLKKININSMDIVFVMDTTGSMHDEINDLTDNLIGIISILKKISPSLHVGFVAYRDTNESEYVTKTFKLSEMNDRNTSDLFEFVSSLQAEGGGDIPEAVDKAIYVATKMPWRDKNVKSSKVIILIGDAPAHERDAQATFGYVSSFHSNKGSWRVSSIYAGKSGHPFFEQLANEGGGNYVVDKGKIMESILLTALTETNN